MKCIKPDCYNESLLGSLSCADCRQRDYIRNTPIDLVADDLAAGKIDVLVYKEALNYWRVKDAGI